MSQKLSKNVAFNRLACGIFSKLTFGESEEWVSYIGVKPDGRCFRYKGLNYNSNTFNGEPRWVGVK